MPDKSTANGKCLAVGVHLLSNQYIVKNLVLVASDLTVLFLT